MFTTVNQWTHRSAKRIFVKILTFMEQPGGHQDNEKGLKDVARLLNPDEPRLSILAFLGPPVHHSGLSNFLTLDEMLTGMTIEMLLNW